MKHTTECARFDPYYNCICGREAKTRLLAAAPDLLKACKMVVRDIQEGLCFETFATLKCREAIRKAEGK